MSQLLHVEIPNFGATVLGSLNEQRLLGHYCDVSILVKGQAFKAHRAVLAASSLYFRDLFSSSTKTQFELPSSVTPACFEQILTFCYTGKLTMAASEQLVVMYTAGYLQIQHIVEKGMDLMFKANSPHCDSQTAGSLEETGSEPQSPCNNGNGLAVAALLGTPGWSPSLRMPNRKIKLEKGDPTPLTIPTTQSKISSSELGSRLATASSLFYTAASGGPIPGLPSYYLQGAGAAAGAGGGAGTGAGAGAGVERSSPGASSLPTTDSPTSYKNDDEEFEEEPYDGITEDAYSHLYGRPANPYGTQVKADRPGVPLALENRNCVLIRRDLVALPASLISQIGYRCHHKLYTEGDPGEKLELVAGTQVFMTRGQLMNCHLCAGIKHKVLLRRLLATFFDRNTLANSCGTGIRSSTSDPSRKPLDSRVLNTVKLYCQNFNPNFKESEMNVIAADMCTNARRVRKRWLPKIKSMLPDGMEVYRAGMGAAVGLGLALGPPQQAVPLPFESLEQRLYPDCKDPLRTHPTLTEGSPGSGATGAEAEGEGEGVLQEEQEEDEDEAGLEGGDGSLGAPTLIPGAEVGNCSERQLRRKRWLPKIKSMLPDGMEVYRTGMGMGAAVGLGLAMAASQQAAPLPLESDFKTLEQRLYPDRKDPLRTHSTLSEGSPGSGAAAAETEGDGEVVLEEQEEDEDGARLEGGDGSLGAPTLIPGAKAGNCSDAPSEQEVESFGQGLIGDRTVNVPWAASHIVKSV